MTGLLPSYDDDMDVSDDDGGVPLNLSSGPTFDLAIRTQNPHAEPASSESLDLVARGETRHVRQFTAPQNAYFQDPSSFLDPGAQLWCLPVEPTQPGKEHAMHNVIDSMPGHIFAKSCKLIQEHWGCEPQEALPELLREVTPYSLALLLQLRMLASYAKKDRLNAHDVLINQWQSRMNSLARAGQTFGGRTLQTTQVMDVDGLANLQHMIHCELDIQENIFGLTLQDVAQAIRVVKNARKIAKNAGAKQDLRRAGQDQQLRLQEMIVRRWEKGDGRERQVGARKLRRQEQQVAKAQDRAAELSQIRAKVASGAIPLRVSKRLAGQTAVPPTAQIRLTLDEMQAQWVALMSTGGNGTGAAAAAGPSMDVEVYNTVRPDATQESGGAEMAYETFTNQDQQAYKTMTGMMGSHLRMQDERGRRTRKWREKKEKTLQALAETGGRKAGSDGYSLPSERVDYGALQALHAGVGEVGEREMAEAMKALELAQMGQQPLPPVSAPEGTSYDISTDDTRWFRQ
ncbi:hypothetical protein LTR36_006139 [Oleoguttula mirabilis]|uniref:Uncharacterized protein n=1 Tax=Oleoguttula mirabilis TaxID=1507867 RepID=A0AAV9JCF2_9PEZI|nr:hypothetical protein LTR36_006139 [Oleoguttula mirabilis]